jgi:hypothetical protein
VYDTGIDLANDSVFSSQDGGVTWPHGTTDCHDGGDRPWLAGGKAGEVFTSIFDEAAGRELFYSKDFGDTCSATGIANNGTFTASNGQQGTWFGSGKLVYDPFDGSVIEPAGFTNPAGSAIVGVGISRLAHAADAFNGGGEKFQPVEVVSNTSVFSSFGGPLVISMDSAENIYFAWDTDDRVPNTAGGCASVAGFGGGNISGGPFASATPAPNHIMFVAGKHIGPLGSGLGWQFTQPIDLANQGNARVLWPWSVAGADGNVSVVWYQMDQLVDPGCGAINGNGTPADPGTVLDVKTFIFESTIRNATDPAKRKIDGPTNASGRFIHQGGICDGGTLCAATGQDRRLGDYFTNSIDPRGCVIIASGDTTTLDPVTGQPRITSLPIFIKQSQGPSLTTGRDCASPDD